MVTLEYHTFVLEVACNLQRTLFSVPWPLGLAHAHGGGGQKRRSQVSKRIGEEAKRVCK